ncbi:MAG: hypothetical protein A2X66_01570 [Ignavibacteria bacterium GWA2_54_16]|nr:MAG: hypothetical protein A2X66_01570 [Ignavibacteria bacterium GWA2_54_16]
MRRLSALSLLLLCTFFAPRAQSQIIANNEKGILIRCDDLGMCHAVNMAAIQVLKSGLPVSFSVMFACPWYQEAVDILRRYPHASVGVHLTLNAEWKNYRWGPIAGRLAVPSLVDSLGYFFPTRAALFGNKPSLGEIETELRAQIDRALKSGLRIDYLDHHMGAAVNTLETRQLLEKLAQEYGLVVSRYFDEVDAAGVYSAQPANKVDTLLARLAVLPTGKISLFVFHIGLQTPEMDALIDLNLTGPRDMSRHREAELHALLAPDVRAAMQQSDVRALTYRDLLASVGVKNMKRPVLKD